jgi:hypothetical protein
MADRGAMTDRRPPKAVLRVVNPVVRALLGTPLGRAMPQVGVVRFSGRRTGRRYAVVVGVHEIDGRAVVVTPAAWRLNFRGGAPVELRHRGRTLRRRGTLVEDPDAVAAALQRLFDEGTTDRMLGMRVEPGHRVTPEDVVATGRTLVELDP